MKKTERGVVSIFVVIFASLLITVVTISFMRLMTQSVREASTADLSQSAYDAALDGVEDAKRAIASGATIVSSNGCTQVAQALGKGDDEVIIEQQTGVGDDDDAKLSQAYTCVTVDFTAKTIEEAGVNENSSVLIPLRTQGGESFDTVRVGWARDGVPHASAPTAQRANNDLPQRGSWGADTPALLRVRYIWADPNINLNDNYSSINGSGAFKRADNSRTKFLSPGAGAGAVLTEDSIQTATGNDMEPILVNCAAGLAGAPSMAGYDCSFNLTDVPHGDEGNYPKFIQITPLYRVADVSVELLDGAGNNVPFSGVQAVIDSTGRAGDAFRRVQAKVRLDGTDSSISYPSDALVIGDGDLCKNFVITDDNADYASLNVGSCSP